MKKGKTVLSVVFLILLLSTSFVSAGFFDWFKKALGLSPGDPGIIIDNTGPGFTKMGG